MSMHLLSSVVEAKWACTKQSLDAILGIVQDHNAFYGNGEFHSNKNHDPMQAVIGTVGNRMDGTRFSTKSGSVGILHIDGPIIPRSVETASSGPSASLQGFSKELKMMDEDPSINNIVLSFDTPGGMVTGISEFSAFVKSLETPVTGFVYGYAASAGYWIASNCTKLYGSQTAEVGSIGTVAIFEDHSKAKEAQGVRQFELVSNLSPNKRLSPETEEGKVATIKILDEITELFVANVADGRGTTRDVVLDKFGQGSMFLAADAVDRGMLDGITTLEALVADLNGNTTTIQSGGHSMSTGKKLTAAEFKAQNPEEYQAIFSEGVQAEQARMKSLEAFSEKDSSVTAFVNAHKFEAGMDEGKMAMAIFNARDEINKAAAASVADNGSQLADALDNVPAATTTDGVSEEEKLAAEEALELKAALEGASQEQKQAFGQELNLD